MHKGIFNSNQKWYCRQISCQSASLRHKST